MRRKKPVLMLVGAGVWAGALGVTAAAPANAAVSDCTYWACVWEDTSFTTNGVGSAFIGFNRYIPELGGWDYSSTTIGGHDTATSAANKGTWDPARFYKDENYSGSFFTLGPGSNDGDFSNGTPAGGFNDSLDSVIFESEM